MNEWERDPQENWEDEVDDLDGVEPDMNAKKQWTELLKHVRDECAATANTAEHRGEGHQEEDQGEQVEHVEEAAHVDEWQDLVSGPDGLDLKDVCEATQVDGEDADADPFEGTFFTNLRVALRATTDRGSTQMFDKLWRLLMYLRYYRGGMDQFWIKNPRACRKKSATMHWYRCLGPFR